MKIYLVGYMGCGKTTLGKKIASRLSMSFVDLDKVIEEKQQMSVSECFKKHGEPFFRKMEHEALVATIEKDNIIVATGGGTPCFYENMRLMNENGITIYIKLPAAALASRIRNGKTNRPLLAQHNDEESLQKAISEMLEQREPTYNKSKYIVDGININVDRLIDIISYCR